MHIVQRILRNFDEEGSVRDKNQILIPLRQDLQQQFTEEETDRMMTELSRHFDAREPTCTVQDTSGLLDTMSSNPWPKFQSA